MIVGGDDREGRRADVVAADCIVVFTESPNAQPRLGSIAGRQVEFGYEGETRAKSETKGFGNA